MDPARSRPTALTLALTALAGLVLLAAACGDGDDRSFEELGVPDGAPVMDQDRLQFIPNTLSVDAGEEVYFVNSETAPHTITVDGENISGEMHRNDVFSFVFESPGEYEITCDFHPQMRATLTVE